MILQSNVGGAFIAIFVILLVLGGIALLIYFKNMVVVPFNEIHVVSRGNKIITLDGKGRYLYLRFLYGRTIIPKHVLDIEPPLIKLHDQDNLPFGVEISVKVQVTDPQKSAATLTKIDHSTVSKIVEDTVMSAARSIAFERTILDVMKKREEIEQAIYRMVADALSKLGLSAIVFDIKNIRDIEGSDVIATLERVKIAELRKNARISEASNNAQAISVEVEKDKEAKVKVEQMQREKDNARLLREQEAASRQGLVELEKLKMEEAKATTIAKINREKKLVEAQAEADAIEMQAKAASNAVRLKADAEAEAIQLRGEAESVVLKQKGEAMKDGPIAAQIEMMKILSVAQIDSAAKVAEALGQNSKIMYIPIGNGHSVLSDFLPKLDSFLQSGIPAEIIENFRHIGQLKEKEPKSKKNVLPPSD